MGFYEYANEAIPMLEDDLKYLKSDIASKQHEVAAIEAVLNGLKALLEAHERRPEQFLPSTSS